MDDALRGGVGDPAGRCQLVGVGRPERQVDQGVRCFSGITLAPVRAADPVAQIISAHGRTQAGAADECAGCGDGERIGYLGSMRIARQFDEGMRLRLAIGVRHACQHVGHAAIICEMRQVLDVVEVRLAQDQPLRHQHLAVDAAEFAANVSFRYHCPRLPQTSCRYAVYEARPRRYRDEVQFGCRCIHHRVA